jgi:hypothetical protein
MIWLSPAQLKDLGVSKGILHRNRDRWTWRKTSERGRNGKLIEEVLLESMQTEWQRKWLAQMPTQGPATDEIGSLTTELISPPENVLGELDDGGENGEFLADLSERRLTEALVRYKGEVRNSLLDEAQRLASIVEKYEAISPKRFKNAAGKHEFVPEVLVLCEDARCTDPAILAIEPSRGKPKSPHTLDAWLKEFRVLGLAAFLRKPPEPTKAIDGRRADISAEALVWFNNNWKKKPSPRVCHRDWKKEAAKRGWTIPAEGWVWRAYDTMPELVRTLAFKGQKAYTGKYAPFVPRDYRDLGALQILCGDHSVRDVTVMLPDGSLTRPWLTLWQDLRTGLIWGHHLDLTPSSNTIGLAYANGVQTFGGQPLSNPDTDFFSYLYTDQGKDYRCKTLTGQTLEFKNAARIEGGLNVLCTQRKVGFMDEMGLKHILARGYNAREKFIERTHKDISEWEKNTFEAEYCGRGIGHKPERWQAAWARHERLFKKFGNRLDILRSESPFMTIDDYRDAIGGWINEYNHAEHTRSVLGGATVVPVEEYERLYSSRVEIAEDMLAMLLMKADKRKIGKNGVQYFQSNWFFLHEDMWEFKGQEIEIRYTDGDWERIWAVLPNGKVVEASAVGNSGVLNRNKKTMGMVAKQRNHEQKMFREFHHVQQSNFRGETVEDRVAAQIDSPEDAQPPQQERIAVNARPVVPMIGRFDPAKVGSTSRSPVTAEMVEGANVIDLFGADRKPPTRIKEEWED